MDSVETCLKPGAGMGGWGRGDGRGIIISASHNPVEWNALKFIGSVPIVI